MKPICLTICLLFVGAIHAQNWCPPGAQWVYDVGSPWSDALLQLTYAEDTTVDGFTAQRIERFFHMTQPMAVSVQWDPVFTRTNGDLVWEWNGAVWDTLYWFSAVPGDRWQPFWHYNEQCPDHAWEVLDTSTIVLNGLPLRTLLLGMTELGIPTGFTRTIRERLGEGGGYGFPDLPPCGAIYECYCTFACYQDQDINNGGAPCDLALGQPGSDKAHNALRLFPIPAADHVTLALPNDDPIDRLELFSIEGRSLVNRAVNGSSTMEIDLRELASGNYLVRVRGESGTQLSATLVVLR